MKNYIMHVKSHDETLDFIYERRAKNKRTFAEFIMKRYNAARRGWDINSLMRQIGEGYNEPTKR
jgi:ribosomal protein L20